MSRKFGLFLTPPPPSVTAAHHHLLHRDTTKRGDGEKNTLHVLHIYLYACAKHNSIDCLLLDILTVL